MTSHGGPHSATGYSFDFKKQYFAANGYFVFDTNFRSSTGYGDAFKWATWGEWGKKDGEDVVSGIDHVLKRYPIDAKRVGHTGHSYGGFMTNWLITQYPEKFAAAITGAGITNWISDYGTADIYRTKETEFFGTPWDPAARERMIKQSPLTYAGNVKTPTLFVHGEVDQRVPYEEGEQMYFALNRVFARRVDVGDEEHVGVVEGARELVHLVLRPRVAVRLEEDDDAAAGRAYLRRGERRLDLRRVVPVVVNHQHARLLALELEAAVSVRELRERLRDLRRTGLSARSRRRWPPGRCRRCAGPARATPRRRPLRWPRQTVKLERNPG